jgi:hypothetical protein
VTASAYFIKWHVPHACNLCLGLNWLIARIASAQVTRDDLCKILSGSEVCLRTEETQLAAVNQGRAQAEALGVHPVKCGLWGFLNACTAWGSCHMSMTDCTWRTWVCSCISSTQSRSI